MSWRTVREYDWKPAIAPAFDRRAQEGWMERWERLTGTKVDRLAIVRSAKRLSVGE